LIVSFAASFIPPIVFFQFAGGFLGFALAQALNIASRLTGNLSCRRLLWYCLEYDFDDRVVPFFLP
jgi:hypothetical protein